MRDFIELLDWKRRARSRRAWIRRVVHDKYEDHERERIGPNTYVVTGDNRVRDWGGNDRYRWKGWVRFLGTKLYVVGYSYHKDLPPTEWSDDTPQEERRGGKLWD